MVDVYSDLGKGYAMEETFIFFPFNFCLQRTCVINVLRMMQVNFSTAQSIENHMECMFFVSKFCNHVGYVFSTIRSTLNQINGEKVVRLTRSLCLPHPRPQ